MLLFGVLVAILCSYFACIRDRRKEAVNAIVALGGYVSFDQSDCEVPSKVFLGLWRGGDEALSHLRPLDGVRRISFSFPSGLIPGCAEVALVPAVTDDGIAHIAKVRSLVSLDLERTQATDRCLHELIDLKELRQLFMSRTRVTDIGVSRMRGLAGLESLGLANTAITDAALVDLGSMPRLQFLDLSHTAVSDDGLRHLRSLRSLRTLLLSGTNTTDRGIKDFTRALPGCNVVKE